MKDPIPDPEALKLVQQLPGMPVARKSQVPRHRRGERFIKGPVPWTWVRCAVQLPGQALAVGMLIWCEQGIQREHPLKLCTGWLADLGVDYQAARRGIRALERAGLIQVSRRRGRCFDVKILPA
jgi:hypothetical protein